MQDVVLAMLAKEPAYGYDLRSRLRGALGPLGEAMNAGQIYVTLARLAKAGLVTSQRAEGLPDRPDRRIYALTPAGQQRVAAWLTEVSWPRPDLAEFHLKLVAAAAARLADPVALAKIPVVEVLSLHVELLGRPMVYDEVIDFLAGADVSHVRSEYGLLQRLGAAWQAPLLTVNANPVWRSKAPPGPAFSSARICRTAP
ncbi:PadR family transcriptional regulator [Micromonospora sp. NPDC048830]|uniref:PadR family transcriptional regulator n=1 Tax=Micromonospora sp. NPDC048830 TaxID=3364257 RepID=UPI003714D957